MGQEQKRQPGEGLYNSDKQGRIYVVGTLVPETWKSSHYGRGATYWRKTYKLYNADCEKRQICQIVDWTWETQSISKSLRLETHIGSGAGGFQLETSVI